MSLPVFVLSCSGGSLRDSAIQQLTRAPDGARSAAIVSGRAQPRRRAKRPGPVTLIHTRERQVRMGEGCGCCTVRADLLRAIRSLAQGEQTDQVLVHLSPQSDLNVLAKTFTVPDASGAVLNEVAHFESLIVVVELDALRAGRQTRGARSLVERVELAQTVLVDTGDHAGGALQQEVELLVRALNPSARVLALGAEEASLTTLGGDGPFDLDAARERAELEDLVFGATSQADGQVQRVAFHSRRPFHPERLHAWLSTPTPNLVRGRGTFWLASRPDIAAGLDIALGDSDTSPLGHWWAAVPEAERPQSASFKAHLQQRWDPIFGDREQALGFVGIDLDAAALERSLEACLLTEEELAQGGPWSNPRRAFPWAEARA